VQDTQSSTIGYTSRLIENVYVVWIAAYNQYLQLAEPAFFVFELYAKGYGNDIIATRCAEKYNCGAEKSRQFVSEIITGLDSLTPSEEKQNYADPERDYAFIPYSEKYYAIGNKTFLIRYESHVYENYLHPLMEHLQLGYCENAAYTYELFQYKQRIFLRYNGTILGNWDESESQYIKGAAFIQLLNNIYNCRKDDWIATLHASAVSNEKKAIAFSAASGSGKSTLAALLQAHGYNLISDDFVAVDRNRYEAHPFPLALSVKDGALKALEPFYPELNEKESRLLSGNRSGRYLTPEATNLKPMPLCELVFVEYNKEVAFEISPMRKLSALQFIIDESWIPPTLTNVNHFLSWLSETSFYKLRYSDNNKAIEAVAKLLEA